MANPKPIDHYEALFNSKFLRWFHLNESPALVKIVRIDRDVELTLPGGAKDKRPVLVFEQVQGKITEVKPLVLNKTNGNTIALIHGEAPSKWVNKEIVLFKTKDRLRGDLVDCIRVRAKKEKSAENSNVNDTSPPEGD